MPSEPVEWQHFQINQVVNLCYYCFFVVVVIVVVAVWNSCCITKKWETIFLLGKYLYILSSLWILNHMSRSNGFAIVVFILLFCFVLFCFFQFILKFNTVRMGQWWATFLPPRAEKELWFLSRAAHTTLTRYTNINFLPSGGLVGRIRIACGPHAARGP